MKKVTLVLPDQITKVGGTSRSIYEREVELTAEEMIKIVEGGGILLAKKE